jgi:hypothetical protein
MRRNCATAGRPGATKRRSKVTAATALAAAALFSLGTAQATGYGLAGAVTPGNSATGFTQPFSGTPQYEYLAPTEIRGPGQLNQPIGQRVADAIAARLGLSRADAFTPRQYLQFISGRGLGGDPAAAKLVDASVRIFTNTTGRPLYSNVDGRLTPSVLASYGLFVNTSGLLESLANTDAPTRKANSIIAPGGYLGTWCRANGCEASLAALYKSAYTLEAVFGNRSQQISGVAQLVTNSAGGTTSTVGMSMAPSIWIVNFLLLYLLNPSVAAYMPAKWAPIPPTVASAILASPTGQVPFGEYASDFPDNGSR